MIECYFAKKSKYELIHRLTNLGGRHSVPHVALLIIAANAPKILEQFASWYENEDLYRFYVHIDSKVSMDEYRAGRQFPRGVEFLQKRTPVFWGGFTMVAATHLLIERALQSNATHFALLSDDSFPLFAPERAFSMITGASAQRITCWRVPADHIFTTWYNGWFYLDSLFTNPRWVPTEMRQFSAADAKAISAMQTLQKKGKYPLENHLYNGKQWWVLTREIVEKMVAFYSRESHLVESFKYSAVPDESFFPTVLRLVDPDCKTSITPMFDDFSRIPKPFVYSELSEVMIPNERYDSALFIRKIHPEAVEFTKQLREFSPGR